MTCWNQTCARCIISKQFFTKSSKAATQKKVKERLSVSKEDEALFEEWFRKSTGLVNEGPGGTKTGSIVPALAWMADDKPKAMVTKRAKDMDDAIDYVWLQIGTRLVGSSSLSLDDFVKQIRSSYKAKKEGKSSGETKSGNLSEKETLFRKMVDLCTRPTDGEPVVSTIRKYLSTVWRFSEFRFDEEKEEMLGYGLCEFLPGVASVRVPIRVDGPLGYIYIVRTRASAYSQRGGEGDFEEVEHLTMCKVGITHISKKGTSTVGIDADSRPVLRVNPPHMRWGYDGFKTSMWTPSALNRSIGDPAKDPHILPRAKPRDSHEVLPSEKETFEYFKKAREEGRDDNVVCIIPRPSDGSTDPKQVQCAEEFIRNLIGSVVYVPDEDETLFVLKEVCSVLQQLYRRCITNDGKFPSIRQVVECVSGGPTVFVPDVYIKVRIPSFDEGSFKMVDFGRKLIRVPSVPAPHQMDVRLSTAKLLVNYSVPKNRLNASRHEEVAGSRGPTPITGVTTVGGGGGGSGAGTTPAGGEDPRSPPKKFVGSTTGTHDVEPVSKDDGPMTRDDLL